MLVPRLHRETVLEPLRAQWQAAGMVRIQPAFLEARAASLLEELQQHPHTPQSYRDPSEGYQLWRFLWSPCAECQHPLCELGGWLRGDGLLWVQQLTGLDVVPAPDPQLISDKVRKASFFEAYDESGDGRAIAFQVHLTPAEWPAEWGGHLEVLAHEGGAVQERRAPTWNAIDLFDVRAPGAWRRMPLVERHLDGFSISGWYHER